MSIIIDLDTAGWLIRVERIPWRGGNFNNGGNDGAVYCNWNTASNTNINYGARLTYLYRQYASISGCTVSAILVLDSTNFYRLQLLVGATEFGSL